MDHTNLEILMKSICLNQSPKKRKKKPMKQIQLIILQIMIKTQILMVMIAKQLIHNKMQQIIKVIQQMKLTRTTLMNKKIMMTKKTTM